MKKQKPHNFIVSLQLYPFDVMFSVGETDEQLKASLKDKLTEKAYAEVCESDMFGWADSTTAQCHYLRKTHQTVIRLRWVPVLNKEHGTLAHEVFHAVYFITDTIGLTLSRDSDEAFAYMTDYLITEFWNNVNLNK